MCGKVKLASEDKVYDESLALAMLIDVFSERGYHAAVQVRNEEVPGRVDLKTGVIRTRRKKVFRFSVHFQGSVIRRGH